MRHFPLAALLALASACAPEADGTGPRVLYVRPHVGAEVDDPDLAARVEASSFTTIQDAVDAAASGDTVSIPAGTYTESITLRGGVNLDGAGQSETVINGTIEYFEYGDVTISGLSMVDPDYVASGTRWGNTGILMNAGGVTLDDVSMSYFNVAVYANSNDSITVTDSNLSHNDDALVAWIVSPVTVTNSFIASNNESGLWIFRAWEVTLTHNTLVANAYAAATSTSAGAIYLSNSRRDPWVVSNNIVTSNQFGININGADTTRLNNLVWGNTTDYVNDASADATDVAADPAFVNAAEGDYGLTEASPAVDAGSSVHGATTDRDGESRPQGAGYDIGFDEYAVSGYDLVVTEVMANAASESTGEFVEIYNVGPGSVDLAGMRLTDGDEVDTLMAYGSSSTTLTAGAYAVVLDPEYASAYSIDAGVVLMTTGDTEIGNGLTTGDGLTLYESDGSTVIATFSYPKDPGDGVSMELVDLDTGDAAGNWRASQCSSGSSPGTEHCFPDAGDPADLVITEVMLNATDESTGEYVELYNSGTLEVDAGDLVLADNASRDTMQGFGGGSTLVPAGGTAVVVDPGYAYDYYVPPEVTLLTTGDSTIGNGLSTRDSLTLYQADGSTVIDTFSFPTDHGDGVSIEKVAYADADVRANWAAATSACAHGRSPGRLNGAAGGVCDPILITEVMANPLDEDTGELVELYNAGTSTVDLAGWVLTDGAESDTLAAYLGGPTEIAPGGYALVVDSEYAGEYGLASSAVILTLGDSDVGNGLSVSDEVHLYEPGGAFLADAFLYPHNPGNGYSVERVATTGSLDSASNWVASTCASGQSAGATNCASSGGSSTTESSYDLVITEVMANPLTESTGEFVEVYNNGTTDVDLAGMLLWDGDATDTIEGLVDPTDTLLVAGGYAVIFDSDVAGEYAAPSGTLLLTVDDTALGSGLSTSDEVTLYESSHALIDAFTAPSDPGNGKSLERDAAGAWAASTCTSGSSPGSGSCY